MKFLRQREWLASFGSDCKLNAKQHRAGIEDLSDDELAIFDMLKTDNLGKADRERVRFHRCGAK
jgi:hypothetical protein